jgi:hypothetical protein
MSLHPLIEDHLLLSALRQPLRFGDPAQIRALYQVEDMIEDMMAEAEEANVPVERLRRFNVLVTIEAEIEVPVIAADKESARLKAEEEYADTSLYDLAFDVDYYVREVKARKAN